MKFFLFFCGNVWEIFYGLVKFIVYCQDVVIENVVQFFFFQIKVYFGKFEWIFFILVCLEGFVVSDSDDLVFMVFVIFIIV